MEDDPFITSATVFESKTKGGKIRSFSYFNLSIEIDQKLAYGFADRRFFGFLSYTMKILTHRERRDHPSIPRIGWFSSPRQKGVK